MNDSTILTVSYVLQGAFICTAIAAALVVWNEMRKRRRERERAQRSPIPDSLEVLKALAAREQAAREQAARGADKTPDQTAR